MTKMNKEERFDGYRFEYDVNVAGYESSNVFAFGGLHRIVLFLVMIAKVQGERVGRGGPLFDPLQWVDLQKLFSLFVHTNDRVLSYAKQTRYQLIFALHFLLDQKKRHTVRLQRSTQLRVLVFGVQFTQTHQICFILLFK